MSVALDIDVFLCFGCEGTVNMHVILNNTGMKPIIVLGVVKSICKVNGQQLRASWMKL
jgi:hypothetical protein